MIFHYKYIAFLYLLIINCGNIAARNIKISSLVDKKDQQASPFEQQLPKQFKVRVLLDEKNDSGQWLIATGKGIIISDSVNPKKKKVTKQPQTVLGFNQGCLYINGQKLAEKSVKIDAIEGHLGFNNKFFQGSFICIVDASGCLLINQLELEDYVYSVLRSESWPGWPLEVNKVFAIASRTYVLAKVLDGGSKKPYHVKPTNIDQTYNGFHESDTLKNAVEQTKGLIITYNKKPIHAMFDSCCGGVIPADLSSIDFKKAPYLARTKVCNFCKPCKIYQWRCEFECSEFEKMLQKKGFSVSDIKAIEALHDKAGAVQEVAIHTFQGVTRLTGKQMYSLTTKIKSFCYSIQKKLKKIVFEGKGYGHHLGICQWGVRNMVDDGWHYKKILEFSYPGTTCMKLVLK
jgi:stage II sporulation protein D